MDLRTYIENADGSFGPSAATISRIAESTGSTAPYIYMVALGHKRVGPQMALAIESATGGEVGRSKLRPDIYPPEEVA